MPRILIIEPDKKLAAVYRSALQQEGYRLDCVAHAQDAVTAADAQPPDLVLLELQLAGHNGIEFLYEFRSYAEWQAVPVVLLTVVGPHALSITPNQMQQLGVVRCLYKPATTLRQLCSTVKELISVAV